VAHASVLILCSNSLRQKLRLTRFPEVSSPTADVAVLLTGVFAVLLHCNVLVVQFSRPVDMFCCLRMMTPFVRLFVSGFRQSYTRPPLNILIMDTFVVVIPHSASHTRCMPDNRAKRPKVNAIQTDLHPRILLAYSVPTSPHRDPLDVRGSKTFTEIVVSDLIRTT
jgi:hypothetical protein